MTRRTAFVIFFCALSLTALVVLEGADLRTTGDARGYAPKQPIAFSHALHAGEMKIDCRYCHFSAERSRHAGIPGPGLCMNCHRFVSAPILDVRQEEAKAKAEGRPVKPVVSPEIRKIYEALALDDALKPIEGKTPEGIAWIKVHNLPDFVFFDHSRHVGAGVDCAICHGPVETMSRVRQVEDLSMGWCVNCHRQVNEEGWNGRQDLHASTDCSVCHY
ncbi:MAG TPA: hypothetical protein ENK43_03040 [Planctomycetes bacterium]|nr:hypothetical protein [Planctomycetota bacterium]